MKSCSSGVSETFKVFRTIMGKHRTAWGPVLHGALGDVEVPYAVSYRRLASVDDHRPLLAFAFPKVDRQQTTRPSASDTSDGGNKFDAVALNLDQLRRAAQISAADITATSGPLAERRSVAVQMPVHTGYSLAATGASHHMICSMLVG